MESDCMYAIGQSHQVCQDYASVGPEFAMISDGCSSSPDTDLGARYLASAAALWFQVHGTHHFDPRWVVTRASEAASWLGSSPCSLDATLLVAHRRDARSIVLTAAGDGVLAMRDTAGVLTTYHIDDGGAPAYLSYLVDSRRMAAYAAAGYDRRIVSICRDGSLVAQVPLRLSRDFILRLHLATRGIEALFLFSDGVSSFATKRGDAVADHEVIAELCAIKGYRGAFVQRRMRRFLNKTCPSRGWNHHDDVAMAALYVGEDS